MRFVFLPQERLGIENWIKNSGERTEPDIQAKCFFAKHWLSPHIPLLSKPFADKKVSRIGNVCPITCCSKEVTTSVLWEGNPEVVHHSKWKVWTELPTWNISKGSYSKYNNNRESQRAQSRRLQNNLRIDVLCYGQFNNLIISGFKCVKQLKMF
jgi:hypothetical protein